MLQERPPKEWPQRARRQTDRFDPTADSDNDDGENIAESSDSSEEEEEEDDDSGEDLLSFVVNDSSISESDYEVDDDE